MWLVAILLKNVHPCTTVRFPHTQGLLKTYEAADKISLTAIVYVDADSQEEICKSLSD